MTDVHALLAALIAGALVVAGVAVLAGVGGALIAAGGWIAVGTVLLYDPEAGKPQ